MQRLAASRAMTLIELMVAVSIIGILVMLLATTTHHVRRTAFDAANQSNLLQIGMGMSAYVHEVGVYPPLAFTISGFDIAVEAKPIAQTGFDMLVEDLLISPRDRQHGEKAWGGPPHTVPVLNTDGQPRHMPVSYGYNIELVRTGARHRLLTHPEERPVLFDGSMSGPDGNGSIGGNYEISSRFDAAKWLEDSNRPTATADGIHVLYADGHVQLLPPGGLDPEALLLHAGQ